MESRVRSQLAGVSTHSSKTIRMSAPSAIWTAMECSGENICLLPSRCERNSTPSSVSLRSFAERKDLETAGVRQQGAAPIHEAVDAADAADELVAGAEVEVVGVGEDDLRAGAGAAEGFKDALLDCL